MLDKLSLKNTLDKLKIKADWIGIREVKESTTYRVIRDLKPESNSTNIDHGIMVEVLINGQFGYCASHDMSSNAIQKAAEIAQKQALNASKYSICKFTEDVRPKAVGEYNSPYAIKDVPLDSLMDTLISANKILKEPKKSISAISMARIVDTEMKYVSTNGSNLVQNFKYVGPGYRVIAQDGKTIQGFNIGSNTGKVAGQSINHCHIHLIPRRLGDVKNPQGGVRGVIPLKQHYLRKSK